MSLRSYDQYCPIAIALDLLGDRWTLLIMRELVTGERRFTDLKAALPGIAPNLLSDRLRELVGAGLVEQRQLPPPAARTVYAPTDDGLAVRPVLRSLARFGAARLGPVPDDVSPSPRMAVCALLAPFHRPEPAGHRFHARLHVDGETFDVRTDGADVSLRPHDGDPDLDVHVPATAIVAARQRPAAARRLRDRTGDRFADLFQLG